jgi:hypothetical protein
MAILPNQDEDKEKEMEVLGSGQEEPISEPTVTTGVSAPSTPTSSDQQKGSGQFTGIRKYVKAGKGSGERIGQALGKEFEQEAGKVGTAIQDTKQKEQQRLQQAGQDIGQARTFALEKLSQAQTGQSPEEQEAKRFQDILKEDKTKGLTRSLNLARPELQRARSGWLGRSC